MKEIDVNKLYNKFIKYDDLEQEYKTYTFLISHILGKK